MKKYLVWHKRPYVSTWGFDEFETIQEVAEAIMRGDFAPGFIIARRMGIAIRHIEECDVAILAAGPGEVTA